MNILGLVKVTVAAAIAGGCGYLGYTSYLENKEKQRQENEARTRQILIESLYITAAMIERLARFSGTNLLSEVELDVASSLIARTVNMDKATIEELTVMRAALDVMFHRYTQ